MDEPTNDLDSEQMGALTRLAKNRFKLDPDRRALVEEMAKKYNIPLGKPHEFADVAKVAALPTLGQIAGGSAGAMSGNPALVIAGEMAGGVIGTKANEMFGISQPDSTDYALSMGIPPAAAGLTKLGRYLIPGHSAAEQEIAVGKLRGMPSMLEGSRQAVDAAYAQVGNMRLPTANFSKTVNDLLGTEETMKAFGMHNAKIRRAMDATTETLIQNPQGLPMQEVNGLLKRYREKVASLDSKGGEEYGAYKALRKALFADMDAAVASGAGTDAVLLRQAMGEAKKKIAKGEFVDLLAQHGTRFETVLGQTFEVIQPTKVLNKLKDIGFDESVGKETANKIYQTLKTLAKVERPSESFKTGIGSQGRAIAMGGAALLGGAAAHSLGPQGVIGGGATSAILAYGAVKAHDWFASLMMSDTGRKFLVKLFTHNEGRIGERTAQVLQFAAAQFQGTGQTTPKREAQANALVDLAMTPNPDEERRLALGIPQGLTPRLEQAP